MDDKNVSEQTTEARIGWGKIRQARARCNKVRQDELHWDKVIDIAAEKSTKSTNKGTKEDIGWIEKSTDSHLSNSQASQWLVPLTLGTAVQGPAITWMSYSPTGAWWFHKQNFQKHDHWRSHIFRISIIYLLLWNSEVGIIIPMSRESLKSTLWLRPRHGPSVVPIRQSRFAKHWEVGFWDSLFWDEMK